MRISPKVLLPLVLIAASLAGAGYLRATRPEVAPKEQAETVWTVRTATVEHRDHQPTLDLYGEVVAGREATIRPRVGGEVIEASPKLREGGRFAEGELMLRIDPFDYRSAVDELDAQIAEAEARRTELRATSAGEEMSLETDREQLALIRRDVERFERLSTSSAASEKSLDDAKIAFSRQNDAVRRREQAIVVLEAQLAQADAAIDRLTVQKNRAERDLADTVIEAPFAGLIADVEAELGQTLGTSDAIARLIDDRALEISFELADRDFGRLWQSGLIGGEVVGRWTLGETTFELPATIARIVPAIDPSSGGVAVYAIIDDAHPDMPLRPGAFIRVEMQDRLYEDVVELPASALFGKDTVYVVEDDRLREATVDLLSAQGDRVLIAGDIADGAEVVTSRLAEIGPGIRVEVVE